MKKNSVAKNTIWLFVFNIAKILFPFVTLPYLTRVLTTETYGVVTYVKTVMTYMQIFVDFGFVLSGTKSIVNAISSKDKTKVGLVIGDTMCARMILGLIGFLIVLVLSFALPILRENILYTLLSYFVVFESIFLLDFVFRGFEKMHVIATRFVLMKTISTILTFVLIKSNSNLLLIPVLDIVSSTIAVLLVFFEYRKLNVKITISKLSNILRKIKDSFIYFLSNAASTSFNALSTIIIGIVLSKSDVAYWGICMQIIGTIHALYNPISEGLYPEMIRTRNINLLKKQLKIFGPLVIIGSIAAYFLAPLGMKILGGDNYLNAVLIFRILIPCLIIGFPSIMIGWPLLGAIGMQRQVTISTVSSVLANIALIITLILIDKFTLISVAIVRVITELTLFIIRFVFYYKNRDKFVHEG